MFSLEIHCRKVSNAEASQLKERVNWKASRATSGAAYFCEVRIFEPGYLVLLTRLATWNSRVADQVGNLELSWCRFCSQLSVEKFFWLWRLESELNCRQSLLLSSFIPRVVRTCHIFIGSRLKAQGCEQNQSFWHRGVMFTVW